MKRDMTVTKYNESVACASRQLDRLEFKPDPDADEWGILLYKQGRVIGGVTKEEDRTATVKSILGDLKAPAPTYRAWGMVTGSGGRYLPPEDYDITIALTTTPERAVAELLADVVRLCTVPYAEHEYPRLEELT